MQPFPDSYGIFCSIVNVLAVNLKGRFGESIDFACSNPVSDYFLMDFFGVELKQIAVVFGNFKSDMDT